MWLYWTGLNARASSHLSTNYVHKVCQYLTEITREKKNKANGQVAENEKQNMLTLRIVELCRHMLTIGLFRTKEDIVNLVKPVIALLDGLYSLYFILFAHSLCRYFLQ